MQESGGWRQPFSAVGLWVVLVGLQNMICVDNLTVLDDSTVALLLYWQDVTSVWLGAELLQKIPRSGVFCDG